MGKKSGPAPPPAPDPVAVSNAQSAANIETAREQQRLNMVNATGPNGSVTYTADPTAPGGYRQTTSLSPDQQAIYDAQQRTELGATNTAFDQMGRVNTALQQPLDTAGLPNLTGGSGSRNLQTAYQAGTPIQTGYQSGAPVQTGYDQGGGIVGDVGLQSRFDTGRPLTYGFDPGQQVQGQVGGDLNAARYQNMLASYDQQAHMLDPRFARDETSLRQRLADQGFSQNDTGYAQSIDDFQRNKNAAYQSAIDSAVGQGETAANNLFQRQLGQGQFANSAAAQEYAQNQGQAAFHNQTAGQDYSQNLGAAQFGNEAQLAAANFHNQAQSQQNAQNAQAAAFNNAGAAQQNAQNAQAAAFSNAGAAQQDQRSQALAQFYNQAQGQGYAMDQADANLNNQARNQGLQERAYVQNQPINQLSALLGMGQVQMPQGIQYNPSNIAPTDVLGAYALNQQAQNAAYQAQMQNRGGMMGGLFSLGSAAILASDGRLKTDKRRLRVRPDGVEVWAFRYLTDAPGTVRIGVMAQQLEKIRPDLVVRGPDGFLAVDYASLQAA